MKKTLVCVVLCLMGATTIWASEPLLVELTEMTIYYPLDGPIGDNNSRPSCQRCFTASVSGNVLQVYNDSDETIDVVVTDMLTSNVVVNTTINTQTQAILTDGFYKLEIYPTSYTPMEGYFEVEE